MKSTEAHAEVVSVDVCDALKLPGIHGIINYRDIKKNQLDLYIILAQDEASYLKTITNRHWVLLFKSFKKKLGSSRTRIHPFPPHYPKVRRLRAAMYYRYNLSQIFKQKEY